MADGEAGAAYRESYPELVAVLSSIVRDPELARDLAQEAGMRLVDYRGELRDARAFLFHVGANLARDALRRHKVRGLHAESAAAEPPTYERSAEQACDDTEGLRRIGVAFERLPPRAREAMWLSRVQGYTNSEVAQAMSLSVKTVEKHLTLGLGRLSAMLRPNPQG